MEQAKLCGSQDCVLEMVGMLELPVLCDKAEAPESVALGVVGTVEELVCLN